MSDGVSPLPHTGLGSTGNASQTGSASEGLSEPFSGLTAAQLKRAWHLGRLYASISLAMSESEVGFRLMSARLR